MGFLLDTNVPSELTRPKPERRVEKWLDDADDAQLFLPRLRRYRFRPVAANVVHLLVAKRGKRVY